MANPSKPTGRQDNSALDALAALSGGGSPEPEAPEQALPIKMTPKPIPPKPAPPKAAAPKPVAAPAKPVPPKPVAPAKAVAPVKPIAPPPKPPAAPPKPIVAAPKPPKPVPPAPPMMVNEPLDEVANQPEEETLSASGFVGMLAKGKNAESDSVDFAPVEESEPEAEPTPAPKVKMPKPLQTTGLEDDGMGSGRSATIQNLAVPSPKKADESMAPAAPRKSRFDTIAVAKEIEIHDVPEPVTPVTVMDYKSKGGPRRPVAPNWYKGAIPIMVTLSSLLMLISFWAIGALVAMIAHVHNYPLIEYSEEFEAYTSGSKLMVGVMIFALPVAITLGILAMTMQSQVNKVERQKR